MDVSAGVQGIMFGYAIDEAEDCMPPTHSWPHAWASYWQMCAEWSLVDLLETAPSIKDMNKLIIEEVIMQTREFALKNGQSALTL